MVSSHRGQKDTERGGDTSAQHTDSTLQQLIALLAGTHLTPWRGPADDYVGFTAHKFR